MVRPMVGYAEDFPNGHNIRRHRHSSAQLIYAAAGVMTVSTEHGRWVVPPQRAVWVPARVTHAIRMTGMVQMRTLYLDATALRAVPAGCCVVPVGPLLRELILRVIRFAQPYALDGPEARVVAVVLDEIAAARVTPLHLPMPKDRRLLAVTTRLLDDPADQRTLAAWSRSAGASARTLARLFRAETGMSFARWRQQARLLHAMRLLARGEAVTSTALEVGYDSPSAFIAAFTQIMGTTPGRYYRAHKSTNQTASAK